MSVIYVRRKSFRVILLDAVAFHVGESVAFVFQEMLRVSAPIYKTCIKDNGIEHKLLFKSRRLFPRSEKICEFIMHCDFLSGRTGPFIFEGGNRLFREYKNLVGGRAVADSFGRF